MRNQYYQIRIKKFIEHIPKAHVNEPRLIDTTYLGWHFNGAQYVLVENTRMNVVGCFITTEKICKQLIKLYKPYLDEKSYLGESRFNHIYELEVFATKLAGYYAPEGIEEMLDKHLDKSFKVGEKIVQLKENETWVIPTFINLLQNGVDKQIITPNQLFLFKELLSEKLNNNER